MALDWTTNPTGLMYRIGRLIARSNNYADQEGFELQADLNIIISPYQTANYMGQISSIFGTYTGFQQSVLSWRQQLANLVDASIQDPATVLEIIDVQSTDTQSIIVGLIEQALADAQTVQRSTVTIGSVIPQATPANFGNGEILVTKILDATNPPLLGAQANVNYKGLASELAVPAETMYFSVTADSQFGGQTEGAEQWQWEGALPYPVWDWHQEGSGIGPGMTTAEGISLVTDGSFENWATSTTPTNWTVASGATLISQETSTVFRGASALKITGDGATSQATVTQLTTAPTNRTRYCVPVQIQASTIPSSGRITVQFTGTGYAAAAQTDMQQTVAISGTPTGGNYKLSWTGPYGGLQTTGNIVYNASAASVQTALRSLAGLESVVVSQSGSTPNFTNTITFYGVTGDQSTLVATDNTTGGSHAIAVAKTVPGVEGERIQLPAAAFPAPGSWALRYFWITTPNVVPANWTLSISVDQTLDNNAKVYFDSLQFAPVTYHGGVGAVITPGNSRWLNNDRMSFTLSNLEGIFQQFLRRYYKAQFPSATNPTISDTLAQPPAFVADSFTDTNGTQLTAHVMDYGGLSWTIFHTATTGASATFTIQANSFKYAQNGSSDQTGSMYGFDLMAADSFMEVDITFPQIDGTTAGFVFRFQDTNNFTIATLSTAGALTITEYVAGVSTVRASNTTGGACSANSAYTLRGAIEGSNIFLFGNGKSTQWANAVAAPYATKHGLWAAAASTGSVVNYNDFTGLPVV